MKKYIPNSLTSLNLFCGVLSILLITREEYTIATYFFLSSLIFDFFDGFTARILKVKSNLGLQLDSLADIVSFGIAPALIIYNLMFKALTSENYSYKLFLIGDTNIPIKATFSFILAVYSGIRLAKFNIDSRQSDSFIGLPTPANSIFIYSLPLILIYYPNSFFAEIITSYTFLLVLTLTLSFLLVAEIRLFSLKIKDLSLKKNKFIFIFLLTTLILISWLKLLSIPLIVIIYIVISIIQNILEAKEI